MIKNGIARILISLSDLNESVKFYRDIFQMSVVGEYSLDPNTIEQLWNLPPETTGQAVCLKNDEQTTLLELIEFKPQSDKFIRSGGNTTDYGLFTIAFRAKNVDAAYESLKQKGYQFICPPITYTPSWVPVTVKEAIMIAPNDTAIALIERVSEPIPEFKGDFGIMLDTSQVVENIEEVTKFYVDILGLNIVFDQVLPTGMIDNILNLPEGTESRMAFINQTGSKNAALEFIQCSVKGKSLADGAGPPHLGLFAIAFAVDDLSALIQKLQDNNIKILSKPVEISSCDRERARAILVEAPNGVNIQFFKS
ncbi:MAG TPA: VOC family protein [Coleofasciculaceae cyanobacterium]|jgi:catechol 2,3-dioxygenase-like lactoylglutathione lyase family enzyme